MDQTAKEPTDLANWSPPLQTSSPIEIKSPPDRPRSYRGAGKSHQGVDILTPIGTPVTSIGDGKVYYIYDQWKPGDGKASGNFVIIEHPNGIRSEYMHLSEVHVKAGDPVSGGMEIGKSGQTGGNRASKPDAEPMAPHLHFGVWANDSGTFKRYDPTKFVNRTSIPPVQGAGPALGIFGKISSFLDRLTAFPAAPNSGRPNTPEEQDAIRRGQDLSRRLRERRSPNVEQDSEQEIIRKARESVRNLQGTDEHTLLENQQRLNQQRLQEMLKRQNDVMQRNMEMQRRAQQMRDQQQQQANTQRRMQEIRDQQQRLAEEQRRAQQLRDQQQRQAQQQRAAEQARQEMNRRQQEQTRRNQENLRRQEQARQEQQRQQQWRTNQLMVQRSMENTSRFSRPFVSPKLWQPAQPTTMNLPLMFRPPSPPRPVPAPYRPQPFSRPMTGSRLVC
jgi:Peptidase family M23